MQEIFPEYYHEEVTIQKAWDDGLIVFDACVLLELYRYPHASTKLFLEVLESRKDLVWIPFQFALEYQRNREGQITKQLNIYHELKRELGTCHQLLCDETQRLPFLVQEGVLEKLRTTLDLLSAELTVAEKDEVDWYRDDPIRQKIDSIFSGKIGDPYSPERLAQVRLDAQIRYAQNKPPGFKDKGKKNGNDDGDLIGWFQILEKASIISKPVIFVTNDEKGDWWQKGAQGKKIGARVELRREIMERAGVELHMYTMNSFLRRALDVSGTEGGDPGVIRAIQGIEFAMADIENPSSDEAIETEVVASSEENPVSESSMSAVEAESPEILTSSF